MKHRSIRRDQFGMTAVLGLVLVACGADSVPETAEPVAPLLRSTTVSADGKATGEHEDFAALASIRIGEQGALHFYEVAPGTIITTEDGVDASELPPSDGLDAVQRYELLSGERAPAALVSAVERSHQAPAVPRTPIVEVSEPELLLLNKDQLQQGDHAGFRSRFCVDQDREYLWTDVTGDSFVRTKGTNYFKTGVYTTRGHVYMGFWLWDCGWNCDLKEFHAYVPTPAGVETAIPNGTMPAFVVPENHYRAYRVDCRNCTVEAKVLHGAGQTYDFCTNYHY